MRRLTALSAIAIVLALGLSACGTPNVNDVDDIEVDAAQAREAAQRAQVLAALEPLNPLRYHHLDQIIREEQRIHADAVIWARRAREVLDWTDWPPELDGHAEQYAEWLDSLLAAFRDDDAHAAAEPSRIVHALAHTFEATLEAWLSNESLPAVPELAGLEPPMHNESHGGQRNDGEHDAHSE